MTDNYKIEFETSSIEQLKNKLSDPQRVTLIGHVSPDGDALGSTLALSLVLQKMGHTAKVVFPSAFPPGLGFLPGADRVIIGRDRPEAAESALSDTDIIFLMDFNAPKRVEQLTDALCQSKAYKVMIDHHLHPTKDVDLCFSYPVKAATCHLLYEMFQALGWERYIDKSVAECIYTGMSTDTGGFNYNSEDPGLYTTISHLLEHGIEKDRITSLITRSYSIDKVKLTAHLMANNMTFYPEYHTAIIRMGKKEKGMFDYQVGDTEGLVNEPLAAKDIHFSIFLHEQARYTKISLRSKGEFPVNEFAHKFFNGGGHRNAAGAEVYAPLKEVNNMVIEAVRLMHPKDDE